jgi:hypothetical protein
VFGRCEAGGAFEEVIDGRPGLLWRISRIQANQNNHNRKAGKAEANSIKK